MISVLQTSAIGLVLAILTNINFSDAFTLTKIVTTKNSALLKNDVQSTTRPIHQLSMNNSNSQNTESTRREILSSLIVSSSTIITTSSILATTLTQFPQASYARLDPVDRPDLLPSEKGLSVIQTEKFLTSGQAKRLNDNLIRLEKDTGFRVKVLCQAYPNTPGLAIRDYWDLGKEGQKDDKYIVLVVDQFNGKGNALNFNVGEGVKFALPNTFWTRLSSKYGTTFFVRENGLDVSIINAIDAITSCLRSEEQFCVNVPDDGLSLKSIGF